jgi:tetratricopeptide (TPR) repeat protein
MTRKFILPIGWMLVLLWGIAIDPSFAQQTQANPEQSALMLRKGQEAFSRGRYNEAKDFFRKAVQADPGSQKAWSNYDLAQIYAVAEQFKNHGRIIQSTAPSPEVTEALPSPVVVPLPSTSKDKGKIAPAKVATPSKEKGAAASERKKSEPSKTIPEGSTPTPSPSAPVPGGMKILKDEGC